MEEYQILSCLFSSLLKVSVTMYLIQQIILKVRCFSLVVQYIFPVSNLNSQVPIYKISLKKFKTSTKQPFNKFPMAYQPSINPKSRNFYLYVDQSLHVTYRAASNGRSMANVQQKIGFVQSHPQMPGQFVWSFMLVIKEIFQIFKF